MDITSLPTPPMDEAAFHHHNSQSPRSPASSSSRQSTAGSVKSVKPINRISKRASNHSASHDHAAHHRPHSSHGTHSPADHRHKRVWKACERCRMKKTKCDGEFPCKRCKDDGLVCTAGTRKKTEYKQLPRGYAEVLENTQLALIATVHKLYAMIRNEQTWELGEPELNDRGQPIIHNIAQKLGCIRPQNDLDLPVSHIFPEDEAGLSQLTAALEEHQKKDNGNDAGSVASNGNMKVESPASPLSTSSSLQMLSQHHETKHTDRASSFELGHSDLETDYRKATFGRMNGLLSSRSIDSSRGTPLSMSPSNSVLAMSPQSLVYDSDFGCVASGTDAASLTASTLFPRASPVVESFPPQHPHLPAPSTTTSSEMPLSWSTSSSRPASMDIMPEDIIQVQGDRMVQGMLMDVDDMFKQGFLESEFGQLKPHIMKCPNPEVMMGMGDPMIFGGYEAETIRL